MHVLRIESRIAKLEEYRTGVDVEGAGVVQSAVNDESVSSAHQGIGRYDDWKIW